MNFTKTTIRCRCDLDEIVNSFKTVSGKPLAAWSGAGARFQFLLTRGALRIDVSNFVSVTLTILASDRTGAPFVSKTIETANIDNTVTDDTWNDGTKQHLEFNLTGPEMELPVTTGQPSTRYFLVLTGYTSDEETDPDTLAWAELTIYRDGVPTTPSYIQAGNLIPGGAVYDGSGHYVLNVTAGRYYRWTDGGANDTSVTNGVQTVTVNNTNFAAQGATITLNGTAGQAVTAVIYPNPVLTADEIAAFVAGQVANAAGVLTGEQAIGNGVEAVTVDISALALGATPSSIVAVVVKPLVGAMIWCAVVDGSATATEFKVQLSAVTELGTYKLRYQIRP